MNTPYPDCFAGSSDCNCATYEIEMAGDHRIIRSPGKFESQTPAIVHFWTIGNEGFADVDTIENGMPVYKFRLQLTDQETFPELKGKTWLTIYEDNQGFVRQR